jgi:2,4-diketo-3-deoxy-L-fuconate hydrolase
MKLSRFNHTRLGVVRGDRVADVTSALDHLSASPWPGSWNDPLVGKLQQLLPRIADILDDSPSLPLKEVHLNSPIARPSKIIGAPANYALHIEESKADAAIAASGTIKTIAEHGLFLKASSSLVGFGDGISLRFPGRRTDHEAEFVVVIGKEGSDIPQSRALDYVAGYSIGLDVTLRGGEERSFRKSVDSYTVLGPWFVTRDEIENPDDVQFRLKVNGVTKQDANTRDMLFGTSQLISLASSFYKLYPGDLIFTGAPAGVGQIQAGDRIDVECDGIGAGTVLVKEYSSDKAAIGDVAHA